MKSLVNRVPALVFLLIIGLSVAVLLFLTYVAVVTAQQAEERLQQESTHVRDAEKKIERLTTEKRQTSVALARANAKLRRAGEQPVNPSLPPPPPVAVAAITSSDLEVSDALEAAADDQGQQRHRYGRQLAR